MERGRILILGQSKESTYEIRSLLDKERYELEIALSHEVGRQVLSNRRMNVIMIHTEMLRENDHEFFQFLRERGIDVPVLILGDDVERLRSTRPGTCEVHFFQKPYTSHDVLSCLHDL